jgi:hypothetical protein
MFKPGDIVIGSTDPSKSVYSATGAKLVENSFSLYGTEDQLEQMEKELITSVTRNGGKKIGTLSSTEKKKTKKIKKPQAATNTSFIVYNEPEDISDFAQKDVSKEEVYTTVQFENDFGKIKAKAIYVADHEQAIMLVFKNEEEVVFEPKVGEKLQLYVDRHIKHHVYYPGVTFNSPFDNKRFMILFKVPEETND